MRLVFCAQNTSQNVQSSVKNIQLFIYPVSAVVIAISSLKLLLNQGASC